MALRISNNGNLLDGLGSKSVYHRVILNTSGLGDRRQRKAIARAKMQELTPLGFQVPPFAEVRQQMTGIIRSVNIRFTIIM